MRKENVTGEERQEGSWGPCSGVYMEILDIYTSVHLAGPAWKLRELCKIDNEVHDEVSLSLYFSSQ